MSLKAGLYVDAANLYRKDGPSINYRVLKECVTSERELLRSNAYVTVDPENPRAMYCGEEKYWRDIGLSLRVLTTELNKQKHLLKNGRDVFLVVHCH